MKRLVSTLLIFVVIFSAVYSGMWFYHSSKVKDFAIQYISEIVTKIGGVESEFNYANASVTGFPFNYNLSISGAKVYIEDVGISSEIVFEEDLVVRTSILGSEYNITIPEKILYTNLLSKKKYDLRFNNPPNIYADIGTATFIDLILGSVPAKLDESIFGLEELRYTDDGYKVTSVDDPSEYYTISSENIGYKKIDKNKYNITYEINDQYISKIDELLPDEYKGDTLDFKIDVDYLNGDNYWEMFINTMNGKSAIYEIDVKGDIANKVGEALPYKSLQIKISNYVGFVSYYALVINNMIEKGKFPAIQISQEQVAMFTGFLKRVSSEAYDDGEGILLVLRRDEGGQVYIGRYGFFEALRMLSDKEKK